MIKMQRQVIVSLISEQTIPNILYIKEMMLQKQSRIDFIFIYTEKTVKILDNLKKVCGIQTSINNEKMVNHLSPDDIKNKLCEIEYSSDNEYCINLTGGTKIMSLSVFDFFETKNNLTKKYIYVDKNKYFDIRNCSEQKEFTIRLSVQEFIMAYGHALEEEANNTINANYDSLFSNITDVTVKKGLQELRKYRNKSVSIKEFDYSHVISTLSFTPSNREKLTKAEIRFLTGDWFEKYLIEKVRKDLYLENNAISCGKITWQSTDPVTEEEETESNYNELDVVFVFKNQLFIIECKTSYLHPSIEDKNGEKKTKMKNILDQFIDKGEYIKNQLGLHAHYFIFHLLNEENYVNGELCKQKNMKRLKNKAKLSKPSIRIIDYSLPQNRNKNIREFLNIKD